MQISQVKTSNGGFSLIEVLIGLALLGTMMVITVSYLSNDREVLDETINDIDRAVRYATNEAIVRNVIVRIRFDLDSEPSSYVVEYGQDSQLVLPEAVDLEKLAISDREEASKRQNSLDRQFAVTEYFLDGPREFDSFVQIYGVGSTYQNDIITEGQVSVYVYPSGEKDSSVIFFHNEIELVALKIPSFEEAVYDEYYTFTENEMDFLENSLQTKTKEIFEAWLKE